MATSFHELAKHKAFAKKFQNFLNGHLDKAADDRTTVQKYNKGQLHPSVRSLRRTRRPLWFRLNWWRCFEKSDRGWKSLMRDKQFLQKQRTSLVKTIKPLHVLTKKIYE